MYFLPCTTLMKTDGNEMKDSIAKTTPNTEACAFCKQWMWRWEMMQLPLYVQQYFIWDYTSSASRFTLFPIRFCWMTKMVDEVILSCMLQANAVRHIAQFYWFFLHRCKWCIWGKTACTVTLQSWAPAKRFFMFVIIVVIAIRGFS